VRAAGVVLILVAGWVVIHFLVGPLRRLLERSRIDPSMASFVANTVRSLILVAILVAVLQQVGVPMASLLTLLGAAGLAIALSLPRPTWPRSRKPCAAACARTGASSPTPRRRSTSRNGPPTSASWPSPPGRPRPTTSPCSRTCWRNWAWLFHKGSRSRCPSQKGRGAASRAEPSLGPPG